MANFLGLFTGAAVLTLLSLALLWRVGSWLVPQAEALNEEEGLDIGSPAPEVAAQAGGQDYHLSFLGRASMVVFGLSGCGPCEELLRVGVAHPATSHMRLVYLSDSDSVELAPELRGRWEVYALHEEAAARRQWRAPVSPYFHVVDERGVVVAKGVASRPEHLDRLFAITPDGITTKELHSARARG